MWVSLVTLSLTVLPVSSVSSTCQPSPDAPGCQLMSALVSVTLVTVRFCTGSQSSEGRSPVVKVATVLHGLKMFCWQTARTYTSYWVS